MTHAYIVVIREAEGNNARAARRFKLHIPVAAARGEFKQLSDRALNDLIKDLGHEQKRRSGDLFEDDQPVKFNPFASQCDS